MACSWGQEDTRVVEVEGPVWDKAQEQGQAERENAEVGTWACLPAGEEVEQTVGDEMRQEGNEAMKTVRWIKGETWEDEPMTPAAQVLTKTVGRHEQPLQQGGTQDKGNRGSGIGSLLAEEEEGHFGNAAKHEEMEDEEAEGIGTTGAGEEEGRTDRGPPDPHGNGAEQPNQPGSPVTRARAARA
ncbi:unnamed protein product [Closterium sp. NIES-54]